MGSWNPSACGSLQPGECCLGKTRAALRMPTRATRTCSGQARPCTNASSDATQRYCELLTWPLSFISPASQPRGEPPPCCPCSLAALATARLPTRRQSRRAASHCWETPRRNRRGREGAHLEWSRGPSQRGTLAAASSQAVEGWLRLAAVLHTAPQSYMVYCVGIYRDHAAACCGPWPRSRVWRDERPKQLCSSAKRWEYSAYSCFASPSLMRMAENVLL